MKGDTIKPILSILIPVYNGEGEVGRTIRSLSPLLDRRIQFLLSNNFSQDNTAAEVEETAKLHLPSLEIFEQTQNIGLKKNCEFLAEKAQGDLIWFVSAGEIVKNTSAKEILDLLAQNPGVTNFVLRGSLNRSKKSRGIPSSCLVKEDRIPFSETIALNIFQRELMSNLPKMLTEPPNGDVWPHVEALLSVAPRDGGTIFVDNPEMVGIADNIEGWWFHGADVWDIYLKKLQIISDFDMSFEGSRWSTQLADHLRRNQFLLTNIEARKNSLKFGPKQAKDAVRAGISSRYVFLALAISSLPPSFLSAAIKIYRNFRAAA